MAGNKVKRTSRGLVALGVVPAVVIAAVGSYAGVSMQWSVGHCIGDAEQRRQTAVEEARGEQTPASQQEARPPKAYGQHRGHAIPGDPRANGCPWPGVDEERVVARASLAFAFYGFMATLLFGVIGILGIYLTYVLAREEVGRRRP